MGATERLFEPPDARATCVGVAGVGVTGVGVTGVGVVGVGVGVDGVGVGVDGVGVADWLESVTVEKLEKINGQNMHTK